MASLDWTQRILIPRDLKELAEIERQSFWRPWNGEQIEKANKRKTEAGAAVAYVAELTRKSQFPYRLIGYMIFEPTIGGYFISRLCVDPDFRRIRVAATLVSQVTAKSTLR